MGGLKRKGKSAGKGEVIQRINIITVTPTERIAVTTAQNRNLPLAVHAATPASAAANAYIPGQSQSIKNPKMNRMTAIASVILLTLAFTEAGRVSDCLLASAWSGG